MKRIQPPFLLLLLCLMGLHAQAQEDSAKISKADSSKKHWTVSIGSGGVYVGPNRHPDSARRAREEKFTVQWGMLDLGFNRLDDKTDYDSRSGDLFQLYNNTYIQGLGIKPSATPFKLNEGKSINVNVWIANTRLRLAGGQRQKLYFTSGIGLQMYNFRFNSGIMYKSDPNTYLATIPSNLDVEKNKLGFTYAAVPIGLLAKTRITEKRWLVYGASVTGGYRIASWTKLKTAQHGKEKNHDPFNFSDFNVCVMAEIGIDNAFRLYGSYQLTPLSNGPLNQHPFAIGIRFFGL